MPKIYDAIKAKFLKEGKSLKEAKKRAAMTYNSMPEHKSDPMTRNWDETHDSKGNKKRPNLAKRKH